eukprot:TRINITY_DN1213_c0_g2_i3.p1 TRINITY_DN1213_c0_g2~~TRINITY_DN1213_c0_g2_i3.p1  ORF type:complete len:197 (+),score=25.12 TRINITY_DN1213_c0_g2_i3:51-641(+)
MLDVAKHLAFYGSYHSDPINILTHIVCVPAIETVTFGLGVQLSKHLAERFTIFRPLLDLGVNLTSVYAACIVPFYLALEPLSGSLRSVIVYAQYSFIKRLVESPPANLTRNLLLIKGFGWLFQIIAHKFFEGRAPALLDNLLQAVVLAPYFVLLEIMFFFGYKPTLKKRVDQLVKKAKADFLCDKGAKSETLTTKI